MAPCCNRRRTLLFRAVLPDRLQYTAQLTSRRGLHTLENVLRPESLDSPGGRPGAPRRLGAMSHGHAAAPRERRRGRSNEGSRAVLEALRKIHVSPGASNPPRMLARCLRSFVTRWLPSDPRFFPEYPTPIWPMLQGAATQPPLTREPSLPCKVLACPTRPPLFRRRRSNLSSMRTDPPRPCTPFCRR